MTDSSKLRDYARSRKLDGAARHGKQAVDLKNMRYAKTDEIPLALQDWMD